MQTKIWEDAAENVSSQRKYPFEEAKYATGAIPVASNQWVSWKRAVAQYVSLRNSHRRSNRPTPIPKVFSEVVKPKMQKKFEKMQQKCVFSAHKKFNPCFRCGWRLSIRCQIILLKSPMNLSPFKTSYKKEIKVDLQKGVKHAKSACTCQVFNVWISSEIAKNATEAIPIARSRLHKNYSSSYVYVTEKFPSTVQNTYFNSQKLLCRSWTQDANEI